MMLAAITRRYVRLTQQMAAAAQEQLRFQQQTERSDAGQWLTLTHVFLGNIRRLPNRAEHVERLREVSIWRHGDVSTFGTLAASVLGSMAEVHEAIQALNGLRAKVDAVRQT